MKKSKKVSTLLTIFFSSFIYSQTYFPSGKVETNLNSFSGVNGQWVAISPSNNSLGAYYYQGMNFGFDINNYVSLVNGVGTNDLYFGRWSGGWTGWNKIWHSGNLNNSNTDFSAKNLSSNGLDIKKSYDVNSVQALKIFYQGSWGTPQYASNYRFIDIQSTEEGNIFAINAYGMGIGYNPPSYASSDRLYINGNVGIGTNNPLGKLDIRGNTFIGTSDLAIGSIGSFIQIDQGAMTGNTYSQIRAFSNGGNIFNTLVLQTTGGSVGIGTTTTGIHKLAVEGSIGAREIKVQATGWSDFVFKKEYTLPTLEQVEKQISEKGHLKNIPSEEEVLKNGINLGEMNAKLLQKIEELTLYAIKQEKKNNEQAENIKNLDKQIESLKKENETFKTIFERLSQIEQKLK